MAKKPSELAVMHGLEEIAGQNRYSVEGLRQIGVSAETVVVRPHPSGYDYDIRLGRTASCDMSGLTMRSRISTLSSKAAFFLSACRRFDVFHFHFGHSFFRCHDVSLLNMMGKRCFFEFHGSDLRDYEKHCRRFGQVFDPTMASSDALRRRNASIFKKADGIILHDDELMRYLPSAHPPVYVVPLRVDISQFDPVLPEPDNGRAIRIVHAPSSRTKKGTSFVIEAFNRLREERSNLDLELVLVEGATREEAFAIYESADIVIDQLLIGSYGVFAIEAMALGKPVVTFIDEDMKLRLPSDLPIVSATCDSIGEAMGRLVDDPQYRRSVGAHGRRYVETYHDNRAGARMLLEIYNGTAPALTGRDAFARAAQFSSEGVY